MKKNEEMIESKAMFTIPYGLFVLTTKYNDIENGCIINTVMQITDNVKRIMVAVNKNNYTAELINKSRKFNVSVLSTKTNFDKIMKFGFKSGRETEKISKDDAKSSNGIAYLSDCTNAYLSADVVDVLEYDTHYVYVGEVTEAKVLNSDSTLTYDYYQKNIKPKQEDTSKKGYVCTVCGFVYEGEELPEDYVCPLCLHGPEFFEKR